MQAKFMKFSAFLFASCICLGRCVVPDSESAILSSGCDTAMIPCGYYSGNHGTAVILELNVKSSREMEMTMFLGGFDLTGEEPVFSPWVVKLPSVLFSVDSSTVIFENELVPAGSLSRFASRPFESIASLNDLFTIVKASLYKEIASVIPETMTGKYIEGEILAMEILPLIFKPHPTDFKSMISSKFLEEDGWTIDPDTEILLSQEESLYPTASNPVDPVASSTKSVLSFTVIHFVMFVLLII